MQDLQCDLAAPEFRLAALAFACALTTTLSAERPPNVIVILVDDLGWMDLSCQGSDFYRTPSIDRLADEGMRFTNAYAACAVCSPGSRCERSTWPSACACT